MQTQRLASKPLAQQVYEEGLKDFEQVRSRWQVARLDTPAVRPAIDVQIVFLERGRGWDNRDEPATVPWACRFPFLPDRLGYPLGL